MTLPDLVAVSILVGGALTAGLVPRAVHAARQRSIKNLAARGKLRDLLPLARRFGSRRQDDRLAAALACLPSSKLVELGEEAAQSADPDARLVFSAVFQILTGRRRAQRQGLRISRAWELLKNDVPTWPW